MTRARLAPAKVNLFLHVGPLQADGYHPLASWMVFADVGDELRLEPAPSWSFEARGPFAPDLGDGENLVEAAARKLFERADIAAPPLKLVLDKRLPVAAGLGGGSSDAGAALRLLNAELPTPLATTDLTAIAAELGADGPACLQAASVVALGRGDRLQPAPRMAPLPAVLVNPRKPSFTGAVYRAYDGGAPAEADLPAMPEAFAAPAEVAAWLGARRNDLEAPALSLEPEIGDVLEWLRTQPETLFARMSGSGATCFVLCREVPEAESLAARLAADRPEWWGVNCLLG